MSQRRSLINNRQPSRKSITFESITTAHSGGAIEPKIRIGQQFQVSNDDLTDSNNWAQPISEE